MPVASRWPEPSEKRIAAVRSFNRSYTRAAGLITDNLLQTPHSLTEARVIFELGGTSELTLAGLSETLDLDGGYLSRVVKRLESAGLLDKRRSARDGRRQLLSLTSEGLTARATLDRRSADQVRELLAPIGDEQQGRLVEAMAAIEAILDPPEDSRPVVVRGPEPGDLGWITHRHGVLYAREYGWGPGFEALVAEVIAEFAKRHLAAPSDTAAWIAELDGKRAGCVVCMRDDERTARLRLLLVEPFARGNGIGGVLVGECIRFARAAGYAHLVLWTNEPLVHARPIYERAGFELVAEAAHARFGPEVVGQDWRLDLAQA